MNMLLGVGRKADGTLDFDPYAFRRQLAELWSASPADISLNVTIAVVARSDRVLQQIETSVAELFNVTALKVTSIFETCQALDPTQASNISIAPEVVEQYLPPEVEYITNNQTIFVTNTVSRTVYLVIMGAILPLCCVCVGFVIWRNRRKVKKLRSQFAKAAEDSFAREQELRSQVRTLIANSRDLPAALVRQGSSMTKMLRRQGSSAKQILATSPATLTRGLTRGASFSVLQMSKAAQSGGDLARTAPIALRRGTTSGSSVFQSRRARISTSVSSSTRTSFTDANKLQAENDLLRRQLAKAQNANPISKSMNKYESIEAYSNDAAADDGAASMELPSTQRVSSACTAVRAATSAVNLPSSLSWDNASDIEMGVQCGCTNPCTPGLDALSTAVAAPQSGTAPRLSRPATKPKSVKVEDKTMSCKGDDDDDTEGIDSLPKLPKTHARKKIIKAGSITKSARSCEDAGEHTLSLRTPSDGTSHTDMALPVRAATHAERPAQNTDMELKAQNETLEAMNLRLSLELQKVQGELDAERMSSMTEADNAARAADLARIAEQERAVAAEKRANEAESVAAAQEKRAVQAEEHLRQRIDDADVLAMLHAAEEAARSADAARTAVEERAAAAEKRAGDAAAAIALHINRAAQADMATAAQEKRAVQAEEQLMHHATREAETLALLHRAEEAARAADAARAAAEERASAAEGRANDAVQLSSSARAAIEAAERRADMIGEQRQRDGESAQRLNEQQATETQDLVGRLQQSMALQQQQAQELQELKQRARHLRDAQEAMAAEAKRADEAHERTKRLAELHAREAVEAQEMLRLEAKEAKERMREAEADLADEKQESKLIKQRLRQAREDLEQQASEAARRMKVANVNHQKAVDEAESMLRTHKDRLAAAHAMIEHVTQLRKFPDMKESTTQTMASSETAIQPPRPASSQPLASFEMSTSQASPAPFPLVSVSLQPLMSSSDTVVKVDKYAGGSPPLEVVGEVPVEIVREVEKQVIKEVIKEVPIEVIREVERVVYRDRSPVTVIKEVIKEVPVEVIKEVPVEVIRYVERGRDATQRSCTGVPSASVVGAPPLRPLQDERRQPAVRESNSIMPMPLEQHRNAVDDGSDEMMLQAPAALQKLSPTPRQRVKIERTLTTPHQSTFDDLQAPSSVALATEPDSQNHEVMFSPREAAGMDMVPDGSMPNVSSGTCVTPKGDVIYLDAALPAASSHRRGMLRTTSLPPAPQSRGAATSTSQQMAASSTADRKAFMSTSGRLSSGRRAQANDMKRTTSVDAISDRDSRSSNELPSARINAQSRYLDFRKGQESGKHYSGSHTNDSPPKATDRASEARDQKARYLDFRNDQALRGRRSSVFHSPSDDTTNVAPAREQKARYLDFRKDRSESGQQRAGTSESTHRRGMNEGGEETRRRRSSVVAPPAIVSAQPRYLDFRNDQRSSSRPRTSESTDKKRLP